MQYWFHWITQQLLDWTEHGRKYPKKLISIRDNLMSFFNMSRNYKTYRATIATIEDMVPYLGLFPKDITSLEEVPTLLDDGSINFVKMRGFWKILNPIIQISNRTKKPIEPNHELFQYLKNPEIIPEQEFREISEQHERKKKNKDGSLKLQPSNEIPKKWKQSKAAPMNSDDIRQSRTEPIETNIRKSKDGIEDDEELKREEKHFPSHIQDFSDSDEELMRVNSRLPSNPRLSVNTDFKISFQPDT